VDDDDLEGEVVGEELELTVKRVLASSNSTQTKDFRFEEKEEKQVEYDEGWMLEHETSTSCVSFFNSEPALHKVSIEGSASKEKEQKRTEHFSHDIQGRDRNTNLLT